MPDDSDAGSPVPESSPTTPAEAGPDLPARIDRIARKYFIVWIWSIVVGVVTSNSMVLINYRPQAKGIFVATLTVPLLAATAMFTLYAWFAVLRFLSVYIIPAFFYEKQPPEETAHLLRTSVMASIMAILTNVALNIADQFLQY